MAIPGSRITYTSDGGGKTTSTPNKNLMDAKSRLSQQAVDRIDKGVIQQPTKTLNPSGGTTAYTPRIVGSTTPQYLNNYTAKSTTDNNNQYYNNGLVGGTTGSGATAESVPVAGGGGESATSKVDDTLNILKSLLEQQKKQADEYQKTLYEQALEKNKEEERLASENANRQYALTKRRLAEMYGNAITGSGLSNNALNTVGWANAIGANQRDMANNNRSALANYNQGLANNASTLAQGWYNYVMPVYTNRQQNADDLDFRKYLASLGLLG